MTISRTTLKHNSEVTGPPAQHEFAQRLIETDRRYFELGSQIEVVGAGRICWMPGVVELPASCVCHRIDVSKIRNVQLAERWLARVENRFGEIGTPISRLYMDSAGVADRVLHSHGYRPRVELGFSIPVTNPPVSLEVELRQVESAEDWAAKKRLHRDTPMGPDGHRCLADQWVRLEQQKVASGDLRCFLIEWNKQICGAVGTMYADGLMRLKNIVVHPKHRRNGIALEAVYAVLNFAARSGAEAVGVFGIEGGAGSSLYKRAGFQVCCNQVEWTKSL